jgi:hypothetical protein
LHFLEEWFILIKNDGVLLNRRAPFFFVISTAAMAYMTNMQKENISTNRKLREKSEKQVDEPVKTLDN